MSSSITPLQGKPSPGQSSLSTHLWRFAVVGGAATLVHVLIALTLVQGFQWPVLWANASAFGCAVLVSYLGNYQWTFGRQGQHSYSLGRFILISLAGLLANQLIVYLVVHVAGRAYGLALLLVIVLVPVLSFLLNRNWVFADQTA